MLDVKGSRDAIEGWMRAGYRSEREFKKIIEKELENIGTTSGRVRELYWNMWVQMQRGELTVWLERFKSIRDVWHKFAKSRGLIERAYAEGISSYWKKYEKVFGLRNKWVHEGKGVSERAIREGCGMNVREIMDDLRGFIEKCGIELGDNPWERDTKILKEHIVR